MKIPFRTFALTSFCLFNFIYATPAQAGFQAYRIQHQTDRIKLDGKLDDGVWKKIQAHDQFYQTQPLDKRPAHQKTEVKIAYDERYLYVGIIAHEKEPQNIRETFARRDKITTDQDFLGLFIDPSGGHKSAQVFYVNARGAVMDGMYSDSSGDDTAPDYEFDVVTARVENGWSAEYRIPFSSIAYDHTAKQTWSLLVMRNMTRDQRYRNYSGEVTRATSCNLCFSDDIEGLEQLPSGMNWSLTPQLVMRSTQDKTGTNTSARKNKTDLSLDMKIRPNSATTIDATLNPDFSQIELDAPQLSGNTRFSIFVSEKRPFFLEGADVLRTPLNAISTRSISNPDAGIRYTRRDAQTDITVLSTRDAAGGLVMLPNDYSTGYATRNVASIATIARVNSRFGDLSWGGILSDRSLEQNRGYNRVLGTDMVWRISQNERVRGQVLFSSTTAHMDSQGNLAKMPEKNGHVAFFDWQKETDHWGMSAAIREFNQDFRADNGFFPQVGFRSVTYDARQKFGRISIWNEVNVGASAEYKLDAKGEVLYKAINPSIGLSGPLDSNVSIAYNPSVRNRVDRNGNLFSTNMLRLSGNYSPNSVITRLGAELAKGEVIDVTAGRVGQGGSLSFNTKVRPHNRLELDSNFAMNWINSSAAETSGQRAYTERAFSFNGIAHLSPKDSLRLILQKSSSQRDPRLYSQTVTAKSLRNIGSLVYTHNARLGTATYLGMTISNNETPGVSLKKQQSEIFAKFSLQL
jgi:hypothetical protein